MCVCVFVCQCYSDSELPQILGFPLPVFFVMCVMDFRSTQYLDHKPVCNGVSVSRPKGVQWPDRQLCSHCPGGHSETRAGEFTQVEGGAEDTP